MIFPAILSVVDGVAEWLHPSLRQAAVWDSCGTGSWWFRRVHCSNSSHRRPTELQYTYNQEGKEAKEEEV